MAFLYSSDVVSSNFLALVSNSLYSLVICVSSPGGECAADFLFHEVVECPVYWFVVCGVCFH